MTIHINTNARKTLPFPPDIRARIQAIANAPAAVRRPEDVGRKVAMPRSKRAGPEGASQTQNWLRRGCARSSVNRMGDDEEPVGLYFVPCAERPTSA